MTRLQSTKLHPEDVKAVKAVVRALREIHPGLTEKQFVSNAIITFTQAAVDQLSKKPAIKEGSVATVETKDIIKGTET